MSDQAMTAQDITDQANAGQVPARVARPTAMITQEQLNDPVTVYMNPVVFDQIQRVAKLMCHASLAPKHLVGENKMPDCFLVVGQALRWGMDPFAVAQATFTLSGKLGYEGKLIAAVVNKHLARRLDYEYSGEGLQRTVKVTGVLKGEGSQREVTGTVLGWQTQNEQWKKNPDQMLAYRGAREWARRHMPEAILGVMDADDLSEPVVSLDEIPDEAETVKQALAPEPPMEAADTPQEAPPAPKTAEGTLPDDVAEQRVDVHQLDGSTIKGVPIEDARAIYENAMEAAEDTDSRQRLWQLNQHLLPGPEKVDADGLEMPDILRRER